MDTMENSSVLDVQQIDIFYGQSKILRDLSIQLQSGSITAIMGRNGVGKTTLLKSIVGLLKPKTGMIKHNGRDISKWSPNKRAKGGIGYVPQGREIFSKLTVYENLKIGLEARSDNVKKVPEDEIYSLFPVLGQMKKRMGGNLSGGQQQQLAIARALIGKPGILLLDEPTEGIQPSIIDDIEDVLIKLKRTGEYSIILVEQSIDFAREVADYFYILDRGTVVLDGDTQDLTDDHIHKYIAV